MTLGVASHVYLPKNPGNLENLVRGMSQITTTDSGLDFTARKRSYGKVMFLHLSVILVTGGGLCRRLGRGVSVQEGLCRKGWGLSRGSLFRGVCPGRPPYSGRADVTHPTGMHSCLPENPQSRSVCKYS